MVKIFRIDFVDLRSKFSGIIESIIARTAIDDDYFDFLNPLLSK